MGVPAGIAMVRRIRWWVLALDLRVAGRFIEGAAARTPWRVLNKTHFDKMQIII